MRDRIMNILYDLAITIGGEVSLDPLLTRTLQQLMLHTDSSCGMVLLADPEREKSGNFLLARVIGDAWARPLIGNVVRLDPALLQAGGSDEFDAALLARLPCRQNRYRRMLRLSVPGVGLIVLLSPQSQPLELPVESMFDPVMHNLARAVQLCHTNDARHADLKSEIRHRTEAQQLSEREFRAIFDNMQDTFYRTDTEGRLLMLSPSVYDLIGGPPEEITGRLITDFYVNPDEREIFLQQLHANGGEMHHHEIEIRRLDGKRIWVSTNSRYYRNERGEVAGVEGIIRNITEHRRLKEQLQQAQKMEALGRLVGGIAHDFNNILAAIQGNVFLAQTALEEGKSIDQELESMDTLSMRAAEMIRQLLAFSRKDTIRMQPLALNAFIRETFTLTRNMIPENIELDVVLPENDITISGDRTQLQQVLINLLNNARDAVGELSRARIELRLEITRVDSELQHRFPELDRAAPLAHLVIADNGHGIPEEQLDKVFEPFFTTKEVNKGTGLGLSMVYGTIRAHGGAVRLESSPGHGTTVHTYIPVHRAEATVDTPGDFREIFHGRGETILLVDDDRDVRHAIRVLLETLGYNTVESSNGEEALALYREQTHRIDLLLTDIVMPRMKGTHAAEAMRRLNSRLPVIFMTGYHEGDVARSEPRPEASELISKPFRIDTLSRTIRQLLSADQQPSRARGLQTGGESA